MEALRAFANAWLGLSATKAEELSTLQVCLRALIVYLVLIGYVRFAKKRLLGEATGFDAILVIVIGSIASRAISGTAPFISSLAGTDDLAEDLRQEGIETPKQAKTARSFCTLSRPNVRFGLRVQPVTATLLVVYRQGFRSPRSCAGVD